MRIFISIHALRAEGDSVCHCLRFSSPISIHALRAEGDFGVTTDYLLDMISIHALRAEGDIFVVDLAGDVGISIHALRAEGDSTLRVELGTGTEFLSTPSVRRATGVFIANNPKRKTFLSTPSVRRATVRDSHAGAQVLFLSTPSVRRATDAGAVAAGHRDISIHALRAEGDRVRFGFYAVISVISIHALRAEGDIVLSICQERIGYFYPRPPCGGRLRNPSKLS